MRIAQSIEYKHSVCAFLSYLCNTVVTQVILQKDNVMLWIPVALSVGIGLYFILPFEPPIQLLLFTVLFVFAIRTSIKYRSASLIINAVLLVAIGTLAAKIKTDRINTPILNEKMRFAELSGTVSFIDSLEEGAGSRVILRDIEIAKLRTQTTPEKVRLRFREDHYVEIGQRIKVLASLTPPSAALIPDGFDFRRHLFFKGIGAVGFIYNAPDIIEPAPKTLFNITALRQNIAERLNTAMEPRSAAIAAALIVGHKNALQEDDKQAIRDAGLAHMLAISGLHVGLVAGTLFFLIRLCLALSPHIALHYPIKKIAAVCALCGAIFYMLLAGSTVPTQRAVLMSAIVFLAIILDRSPISLRLVAFAACLILLINPDSLVSASFHMSFAAVTCLIYFYDSTRKFWIDCYKKPGFINKASLYFISVCITTLIASLATAPFALYHFGQVSFVGTIANLVAVPLLAFMIMPFALLSVCLMPFGLEQWPLHIVSLGIYGILDTSHWAATLPYAVLRMSQWAFTPFLLFIIACLFAILWKGWGKLMAVPIVIASTLIAANTPAPDIIISASHKLAAFKTGKALYVSTLRSDRFVRENWERYYGLEPGESIALSYKGKTKQKTENVICGEGGCRLDIKGQKVAFIRAPYALKQDCIWADILISSKPFPDKARNMCQTQHIIDKFDTWKHGAHAIYIDESKIKIRTVGAETQNRPWSAY